MTNEQLYILLRLYRGRLLLIRERCATDACSEDGQAFAEEIDRLANEMWDDMKRLKPGHYDFLA
jgi:hypothetical protein